MDQVSNSKARNTVCVFLAFAEILLAPLKEFVTAKLKEHFKKCTSNKTYKRKRLMKDKLPCDPDKPNTKFHHQSDARAIGDFNDFAKLYLSVLMQGHNFNLTTCTDTRVFLTLMVKAGCFIDNANLAAKLKSAKNSLAHDTFFDYEEMEETLKDIETMLGVLPHPTSNLRKLRQLQADGGRKFLSSLTKEQMTKCVNSMSSGKLGETIKSTIKTALEQTVSANEQQKTKFGPLISNTKKPWSSEIMLYRKLKISWVQWITNSGAVMNLKSILASEKPKYKQTNAVGGLEFKIRKVPFAKGASRAAYRGHFDVTDCDESNEFDNTSEVVVKTSSEPAIDFLQIQAVAEVFAEDWNGKDKENYVNMDSDSESDNGDHNTKKIEFIAIYVAKIQINGRDQDVTVEEYINKAKYTKW